MVKKFSKVSVIGAGQWGTALSNTIADNLDEVKIITREHDTAASINKASVNISCFPDVKLASNISASDNFDAIETSDLLVLAVPSQAIRTIAPQLQKIKPGAQILIISKGIENETMKLMHQIVESLMPNSKIAVLSGPNFAKYVVKKLPAASIIASKDEGFLEQLSEILNTKTFRCYKSFDICGVEVCGAVKNVIAIASGICEGYGFGENAKAALITRSLIELERMVELFGGNKETVYGLAGVGDIMLTCGTDTSRNYKFGYQIGKNQNISKALEYVNSTVEGYTTAKSIQEFALHHGLDLPICYTTYRILYEGLKIEDALNLLMSRAIS